MVEEMTSFMRDTAPSQLSGTLCALARFHLLTRDGSSNTTPGSATANGTKVPIMNTRRLSQCDGGSCALLLIALTIDPL